MALSKKERDALPDSDFAVPGKRELPMHDATHARLAWDMVERTHGLTPEERREARARILRRARELGIDTDDWRKLKALHFDAMSLAVPVTPGHPNKMPFSGVLTKIGEPSDFPPEGSGGRRVLITPAVAEAALASLLGMAVDFAPGLDGHDVRRKIGIITEATVDGADLRIAGFFYAADFPVETDRIRVEKSRMGFSFEAADAVAEDPDADPLVLTQLVFTGAAVLHKDKAAYTTTSLAASASAQKEIDMTADELKKLIGEAVSPLAEKVAKIEAGTNVRANMHCVALVEPHAKALHAAADAMEKDGIGTHPIRGHAVHLRRMAGAMMAEAHQGIMPHIYRDHDYGWAAAAELRQGDDPAVKALGEKIEAMSKAHDKALDALTIENANLKTKLGDVENGLRANAAAPERKTLPPAVSALLSRADFAMPENSAPLNSAAVSSALRKAGVDPRQRIQVDLALERSGHFADNA